MIVVMFGYFAVKDPSMLYCLWYCIMCTFNLVFDLIYLFIRVMELRRQYFHRDMPFLYNLASAVLIAAPLMAAIGAMVSYKMYAEARDAFFGDSEALYAAQQEQQQVLAAAQAAARRPRAQYGATQPAQPVQTRARPQDDDKFVPFRGQCHRI